VPTRFGHAGPRAQLELMIHHHEARTTTSTPRAALTDSVPNMTRTPSQPQDEPQSGSQRAETRLCAVPTVKNQLQTKTRCPRHADQRRRTLEGRKEWRL
jgi:hypothetical protein